MPYPHPLAELSFLGIIAQIPSLIKSIQHKTITIAGGAASGTESINAVNEDKTICVPGNWYGGDNGFYDAAEDEPRFELTDSTTLTAYTNTANGTEPRVVKVVVVEFQPWAITAIVRDSFTIASGNFGNNVSLPHTFDLDRTACFHLGQTTTQTGLEFGTTRATISLVSGGSLSVLRGGNPAQTLTVSYEIVEFAPGIIKSAQRIAGEIGFSGTEAAISYTLPTPVNPDCTMLAWGGNSIVGSQNDMRLLGRAELEDEDTVTLTREVSSAENSRVWFTVLEFYPKWIKSVQRGEDSIPGDFSDDIDVSVSAVDTNKAVPIYLGWGLNLFAANINIATAAVELIDGDTVKVKRYAGTNEATKVSRELIEFR